MGSNKPYPFSMRPTWILRGASRKAWRFPYDEHSIIRELLRNKDLGAARDGLESRLCRMRLWKPRVSAKNRDLGLVLKSHKVLGKPGGDASDLAKGHPTNPAQAAADVLSRQPAQQQTAVESALLDCSDNLETKTAFLTHLWSGINPANMTLAKHRAMFTQLCADAVASAALAQAPTILTLQKLYHAFTTAFGAFSPTDLQLQDAWLQVLCAYGQTEPAREIFRSIYNGSQPSHTSTHHAGSVSHTRLLPLHSRTLDLYIQHILVPQVSALSSPADALSYIQSEPFHLPLFQDMTPTAFVFLTRHCGPNTIYHVLRMLDTYSSHRVKVYSSEQCQLAMLSCVTAEEQDPVRASAALFGTLVRIDSNAPGALSALGTPVLGWCLVKLAQLGNARGIARLALLMHESGKSVSLEQWEQANSLVSSPSFDQSAYVTNTWPALEDGELRRVMQSLSPV